MDGWKRNVFNFSPHHPQESNVKRVNFPLTAPKSHTGRFSPLVSAVLSFVPNEWPTNRDTKKGEASILTSTPPPRRSASLNNAPPIP